MLNVHLLAVFRFNNKLACSLLVILTRDSRSDPTPSEGDLAPRQRHSAAGRRHPALPRAPDWRRRRPPGGVLNKTNILTRGHPRTLFFSNSNYTSICSQMIHKESRLKPILLTPINKHIILHYSWRIITNNNHNQSLVDG